MQNRIKKTLRLILIFTLFVSTCIGQTSEFENLVEQGIKLHDNGDYKGAIEQYKKALQIDPKSAVVNYELASSHIALEDYEKAIEYSENVITAKSKFADRAYMLKGTAQDLLGKSKEAIKTYTTGLKEFPDSYLLNYNLAYTLYNLKNYKEAETTIYNALKNKPSHASSHLLLGYIMHDQGHRVKSLLALYNFLLLEPKGKRAKTANELLDSLLKKGVTKENEKTTTITLAMGDDSDEFRPAELMLSLLEASKDIESNKNKTENQIFVDNTKSFFSVLGELKKKNKGFWWNFYVDFFYDMTNKKHNEAFANYIQQSKENTEVSNWLKSNNEKIEAFSKWYSDYKRSF